MRTFDVTIWPQLGPYRVMPPEFVQQPDWGDHDFRFDADTPVWSIGRALREVRFYKRGGGTAFVVAPDTILVSPRADLYAHQHFECLWLR